MALPIDGNGKTVNSAVEDLVQWVRDGEPEYNFELRARELGLDITTTALPDQRSRCWPRRSGMHRTDGVFIFGNESVRSDYYIGTDRFIWLYRHEKDGKITTLSSTEEVPPNCAADYAKFMAYARAMTREQADG